MGSLPVRSSGALNPLEASAHPNSRPMPPAAVYEASPTKRRTRSEIDDIGDAIIRTESWRLDQLKQVEQQERETLKRIAGAIGLAGATQPETEAPR
jgi:hypothetical protein